MSHSELCFKNAPIEEIAKIASDIIYQEKVEKKILSIKDVSGNSGAKTFICSEGEIPKCIVKVKGNESIMSSHPNTFKRVLAATENLRSNGIAPPIVLHGADFHIERSAGISVMEDFFHFNQKIAPPEKVAKLLAKLHSIPIDWYQNLKNEFLEQDLNISSILKPMPPFAPCWCLPWSGFDTQMPVLGVGNPNPETAKKIFKLELKTGVYKKIMQCSAFFPKSDAAKREVVVHNDFKPDNILYDPDTKELTAIDYDLGHVGAAVMDFGLPYMMWLGSRFTNFNFRKEFIKSYLIESQLPHDDQNVKDMMLDCEINTIVAFPGLLANIYDAEIPLLRGIKHPTAKAGYLASGPDASPTGLELVDLLAEAVEKIRKDDDLTFSCLEDGFVVTLFKNNGLESSLLNSWLKEMQKNKMLRLFGIAETDGGELFVADHAKK